MAHSSPILACGEATPSLHESCPPQSRGAPNRILSHKTGRDQACSNNYNPFTLWLLFPQSGTASPSPADPGPTGEKETPENSPADAQPSQEGGVTKGMGTVAITQNGFQGVQQGASIHTPGVDWTQLSDAEIMLRVREGDDSGFSILIEKYRKQIVHFMFRMSRNQAVAEELAQEVFLACLSLAANLPGRSKIQHLALPHSDQPGREPRARYQV